MIGRRRCRCAVSRQDGFTLLEVLVSLVLVSILLAITVPVISTFDQMTVRTNTTYTNVNGLIETATTIERLLRSAVAPDPSAPPPASGVGSIPHPAFVPGTVTTHSLTLYADMGAPGQTSSGPTEIAISCLATTQTRCTLTVTTTASLAGSCPSKINTYRKVCTYTKTPARHLLTLAGVRSGPGPIFTYTYMYPTPVHPTVQQHLRPLAVQDTTAFTPCTSATSAGRTPFVNCHAGQIDEITYDISIDTSKTTLDSGTAAEDSISVYMPSASSTHYSPEVG